MRRFTAAGGEETATFKVYDVSTGVTHANIDLSVVIQPGVDVRSFADPLLIKVVGGAPADTTAPVITLTGDATMSVEVGGAYSEAGATSDGGETVTISGAVDVNTAGIYTVTYSASDAVGNAATATRTVTVSAPADTTAPVITLTGDATMSVEVGGYLQRSRGNLRWRRNGNN